MQARYRRIVIWVANAALNAQEYVKAFELLKHIEVLPCLDYDELFYLGIGYWWAAPERENERGERRHALQRSRRFLERAVKMPPNEAKAHWSLGYVYDELGEYDLAIEENKTAIRMDSTRYRNWGYWNMAVSWLKKGRVTEAMSALREIPDGKWWIGIWNDPELKALKGDKEFGEIYRRNLEI